MEVAEGRNVEGHELYSYTECWNVEDENKESKCNAVFGGEDHETGEDSYFVVPVDPEVLGRHFMSNSEAEDAISEILEGGRVDVTGVVEEDGSLLTSDEDMTLSDARCKNEGEYRGDDIDCKVFYTGRQSSPGTSQPSATIEFDGDGLGRDERVADSTVKALFGNSSRTAKYQYSMDSEYLEEVPEDRHRLSG